METREEEAEAQPTPTERRGHALEQAHGRLTAGTDQSRCGCRRYRGQGAQWDGAPGMTLNTEPLHLDGRVTETVVTEGADLGKAPRGLVGMAMVDELLGGGAEGGGRESRWTWGGRFLDLGAPEGGGVAEGVGMNGVDFGTFHAPPIP
jgi:hypothetical protein